MAFDLQQDGWPDDTNARDKFQEIRATLMSGLVRLASAERVPQAMVRDESEELTDQGRLDLLRETLKDLTQALEEFKDLNRSSTPYVPEEMGGASGLGTLIEQALADVGQAADQVKAISSVDEMDKAGAADLKVLPRRVHPKISQLIDTYSPVRKIFVAIHGIGDQFQSETVQSVAFRVCDYVGEPTALPLGRFHGPGGTVTRVFVPDPTRDPPINCGFAEIYWANVPRIPAADKHILEEPRKWAQTLVERLRLRGRGPLASQRTRQDDARLEQLIEELIQGVNVSNRLVFLAERAGLFQFNLAKLLNDYLNDVQVVTEFEDYRRQLLAIFDDVMEKIHRYLTSSEIYIVAHSEGTVIAFMGLLKGLAEKSEWTSMVRGFMTIGSPLNKHVRFWPELFEKYSAPEDEKDLFPIPWKNYYDYGDPIGYDLTPTRRWMEREDARWDRFFAFRDGEDDIGFTRYYFPGAAHNDYWRDEVVFGHFIEEVVDRKNTVLPRAQGKRYGVPTTRGLARLTSYPMPYLLAAVLLFLACFILYKAIRGCLDPIGAQFEGPHSFLANVLGLTGVIGGMSLLARIPRLARGVGWWMLAVLLALFFTSGYFLVSEENRRSIEWFLTSADTDNPYLNLYIKCLILSLIAGILLLLIRGLRPVLITLLPVVLMVLVLRIGGTLLGAAGLTHVWSLPWRSLAVILVALLIGILAWLTSWHYPNVGTKPLVHTGGLIIVMIVATQFAFSDQPRSAKVQAETRRELVEGIRRGDRGAMAQAVDQKLDNAFTRIIKNTPDGSPVWLDHHEKSETVDDRQLIRDAAATKIVADAALDDVSIWPVFLAAPAFLYLWWLAVLLFDLTFVWHLYIRYGGAQKFVNDWFGSE